MIVVKPISSMINLRVLLLLPRISLPFAGMLELAEDAIMRNATGLKAVARVLSSRAPTAAVTIDWCCSRSMQETLSNMATVKTEPVCERRLACKSDMSREEFYSAYTKRLLTPQRGEDSEEADFGNRDLVSIAVSSLAYAST
jgi:hypothetical protein